MQNKLLYRLFTTTASIGIVGFSWTGLPVAVNYFFIGLIIISAVFFGFPKIRGGKYSATGPLIFTIILSTFVDIALIQDRMKESSGSRLSYIQETIPIYSGDLFTTDANFFILNDLIGMAKWICALLFMPMLFGFNSKKTPINALLILNIWIVAVFVNVLVAILNSRGIVFSFVTTDIDEEIGAKRFSGLSSHPNHLATVISLTLPLAMHAAQKSRFPKFNFLIFPFLLSGQILTGSRIGLISFIFAFILSLKFVLNFKVFRLIGYSLVFAFVTFATVRYLSFGFDFSGLRLFSGGEGVSQSNTARIALARQGFGDFIGSPIVGIGPRAFKSSHNIFLQLLASLGILGFCAFVFLLKQSLGFSAHRDNFTNALRISILTILVTGMFSNGLADFFLYLPFGAILGMISRQNHTYESRRS